MFMGGFGVITLKLKEMYQMITLGGDAELELVDSLDPFSEGIVFRLVHQLNTVEVIVCSIISSFTIAVYRSDQ